MFGADGAVKQVNNRTRFERRVQRVPPLQPRAQVTHTVWEWNVSYILPIYFFFSFFF